MLGEDEDSLTCDFAQTYGILDIRAVPAVTAAVLAWGLPEDSRIKRILSGSNCSLDSLLLASIADAQNLNLWTKAREGTPRPASLVDRLLGVSAHPESSASFTIDEFEERRAQMLNGNQEVRDG